DWTILGILGLSMLISFFRGFVREFMALAIWIAAVWVALTFADQVAPLIGERVEVPSVRLAIAFAALFFATLLAGGVLNYVLGLLISQTGLSGTDRFLGLFFGAARGALLLVVGVSLLSLTPLPADPWWQNSLALPRLEALARWSSRYLPEDFGEYLKGGPPGSLGLPELPLPGGDEPDSDTARDGTGDSPDAA
ncbi:MAG: CvpA family protein, partial [Pseudomonadota bacterium]